MKVNVLLILFMSVFSSLAFAADREWVYFQPGFAANKSFPVLPGERCSLKDFCRLFRCEVIPNWAESKFVVMNRTESLSAIISPITPFALVTGKILDFQGGVEVDAKRGVLFSMELASKLVILLRLGTLKPLEGKSTATEPVVQDTTSLDVVVIDPGHGGEDTGTKFNEMFEKDLSLIYAKKFRAELIKSIPGLQAYVTREEDQTVSLAERAKFANSKKAGLFISIHLNHAADSKVNGIETYILSPDATDDEARKLALLENDGWLQSSGIEKNKQDDLVKNILVDMEQTKYIQKSALVAAMIQQEMGALEKKYGVRNRGVKQGFFYVLSQVAMPSILIEMGFLSNESERGRLLNTSYQSDFLERAVAAVQRYRNGKKSAI